MIKMAFFRLRQYLYDQWQFINHRSSIKLIQGDCFRKVIN